MLERQPPRLAQGRAHEAEEYEAADDDQQQANAGREPLCRLPDFGRPGDQEQQQANRQGQQQKETGQGGQAGLRQGEQRMSVEEILPAAARRPA